VATLSLDGDLYGCSIDPGTGNLAVVEDDYGITIFPNAQNPPTTFATPDFSSMQYGSYDDKGNFFTVGSYYGNLELAELPKGGNAVEAIPFNQNIIANVVQWDGKHLAVGGSAYGKVRLEPIYQVRVSGGHAQITGTTELQNRGRVWQQFWIQGNTVIQASDKLSSASFWHYPNGGAPTKTIKHLGEIWGVVISVAPSHKRLPLR
jgi:hypothetical protein